MTKHYFYKGFGLKVCSDVVLPQLPFIGHDDPDNTKKADIHIFRSQKLLTSIPEPRYFLHHTHDGQSSWLHVPNVAIFRIANGQHIEYSPQPGFVKQLLPLMLMSTVMPHLLQQRGYLVLRAMAVVKNAKAYVFASAGADGKSFLAASLMKKGYHILSDDVCVINEKNEVMPGYNRLKIWRDCMRYLQLDYSRLAQIRPELEKYYLPLGQCYHEQPVPLSTVVFYRQWNKNQIQCEMKKGISKFMPLKASVCALPLVDNTDMLHVQVQNALKIASSVNALTLTRPVSGLKVDDLINYIQQNILIDEGSHG